MLSGPGKSADGATAALAGVAVAQQLTDCRTRLKAVVLGINRLSTFSVHDTVLDATAYLRLKFADIMRTAMREGGPPAGYAQPLRLRMGCCLRDLLESIVPVAISRCRSSGPLMLPSESCESLRRTISVCQWAASHCMELSGSVQEVIELEAGRGFIVMKDGLSSAAIGLSRAEIVERLPESVSRRLAAFFVRLVTEDLNSSRPALVYVPSRLVFALPPARAL